MGNIRRQRRQFCAQFWQSSDFCRQAGDLCFQRGDLSFQPAAWFAQGGPRALVFVHAQQGVEHVLAPAGGFQEGRGQQALRHAYRVTEEHGQFRRRFHAQKLSQPQHRFGFAVGELLVEFGIVHVVLVAAPTAAHDVVDALVCPGYVDGDGGGFRAFADEIVLLDGQEIEEGEADGLQYRALARAVVTADSVGARGEGDVSLPITFNVVEVYLEDAHLCLLR
ncbi:MAG: hypothetical protein BWY76_02565 [bacterium ADurb.Bin429]|nr:MAG: hypothetical protein BWY76_02565 [bacterium ADurb.Bin429]